MKRLIHFFILIAGIQLATLSACHTGPQVIPVNPENTDTAAPGNPDSILKYSKDVAGIYHFTGIIKDWDGVDTTSTSNIDYHCRIEVYSDTTIKFFHVDTLYSPIPPDTVKYIRKLEANTIIFVYKDVYTNYATYDTVRYNYINKTIIYSSYISHLGQGYIVNSHSL